MFVSHVKEIKSIPMAVAGAKEVSKKVLVGPAEGWEGWVMRLFTFAPGGHTPRHSHPWPHVNYIVAGKGVLYLDGQEYEVTVGSVAFIPGGKEHQFRNSSETDEFAVICIVPEEGDK